jgi:hypothetical protein
MSARGGRQVRLREWRASARRLVRRCDGRRIASETAVETILRTLLHSAMVYCVVVWYIKFCVHGCGRDRAISSLPPADNPRTTDLSLLPVPSVLTLYPFSAVYPRTASPSPHPLHLSSANSHTTSYLTPYTLFFPAPKILLRCFNIYVNSM